MAEDCKSKLESEQTTLLIFNSGRDLVQVQASSHGLSIESVNRLRLERILNQVCDFVASDRNVQLPAGVVNYLLEEKQWLLQELDGISRVPLLTQDGSLLVRHGYSEETKLFLDLASELDDFRRCMDKMTAGQAKALLDEAIADFPFDSNASKTNAIAFILTLVLLREFHCKVPIVLIPGNRPGTGKGKLCNLASMIAFGSIATVYSPPTTDDELRKKITSLLLDGQDFVLFDNANDQIGGPVLEAYATAEMWGDRKLGGNEQVVLPAKTVIAWTGNQMSTTEDMNRRNLRIYLKTDLPQPHLRNDFKHPNLDEWVKTNRKELLAAVLTLAQDWMKAGRPAGRTTMASFEDWSRMVGGILEFHGYQDFLSNAQKLGELSAEDAQHMSFLEALQKTFSSGPFTCKGVRQALTANTTAVLRESLPMDLEPSYLASNPYFPKMLSDFFGKILDRPFQNGLRIRKSGGKAHGGAVKYMVCGALTTKAGDVTSNVTPIAGHVQQAA